MSAQKLFKKVHLFNGLNDDELAQLAAISTGKNFTGNEIIINQNTTGDEMFVVSDGAGEVFVAGLDNERTLVLLGEGQVFGEMALIDQGYRSASVRAVSKGCSVYEIGCEDFRALCQSNEHIGYMVMRNLAIDLAFKLRHQNLAAM